MILALNTDVSSDSAVGFSCLCDFISYVSADMSFAIRLFWRDRRWMSVMAAISDLGPPTFLSVKQRR